MDPKKAQIISQMLDQIVQETQQPRPDAGKVRELARDIRGMLAPAAPTVPDWIEDWNKPHGWMEIEKKNQKTRP